MKVEIPQESLNYFSLGFQKKSESTVCLPVEYTSTSFDWFQQIK